LTNHRCKAISLGPRSGFEVAENHNPTFGTNRATLGILFDTEDTHCRQGVSTFISEAEVLLMINDIHGVFLEEGLVFFGV
jgi:trans-2-enoyl-CoA reductase